MGAAVQGLMTDALREKQAEKIGECAYRALLEEVYTTPKPGLVDLFSNGAHRDMGVCTFERSAEALRPWFVRMAAQGIFLRCGPEDLFLVVRKTGMEAERAMYRATGGVNTHKGLIFTLGIFCAAAGRCLREKGGRITPEMLLEQQQVMTGRILREELERLKTTRERLPKYRTHGEHNLQRYGTTGVRGEALAGYPSVLRLALPVLRRGKEDGREWNRIKLQALLVLMSRTQDSNILSRTGLRELTRVQWEAHRFLAEGGAYREDALKRLEEMDGEYISRNVSAGGCADLLAASIFLFLLENTELS